MYCLQKKRAEDLCKFLNAELGENICDIYHRALSTEARKAIYQEWQEGSEGGQIGDIHIESDASTGGFLHNCIRGICLYPGRFDAVNGRGFVPTGRAVMSELDFSRSRGCRLRRRRRWCIFRPTVRQPKVVLPFHKPAPNRIDGFSDLIKPV